MLSISSRVVHTIDDSVGNRNRDLSGALVPVSSAVS